MIRIALKQDIEKIKPYLEEFRLDSENLECGKIFIYEHDGVMAGFGRYKNIGDYYELASIGVLKLFRGQGIGKTIVKKLLASIPSEEIWLTTIIPDYFKKFGFEKNDDVPENLILKTSNICAKYNRAEKNSVFMRLKKTNFIIF